MKKSLFAFVSLAVVTGTVLAADPKDDVKAAAKKLAAKTNYSWVSTPKSEGDRASAGAGPMEGATEKGGFTAVTFTIGNAEIELAFKGDKAAIKREGEWMTADELQGDNAWIANRLKQFKAPAAEAEDLAEKTPELKKKDDGLYGGELSEAGIKELFARVRRRENGPAPEEAKGWTKFWIKDGVLTKYQYNVQGKLTVGDDKREVEINRTTTVEIKEVGTTTIKISDEVKKKLST